MEPARITKGFIDAVFQMFDLAGQSSNRQHLIARFVTLR
jgi:hypothetical protein